MTQPAYRNSTLSMFLLCGAVLTTHCYGKSQETIIYSFQGGKDGGHPLAGLTKAGDLFYGTTNQGGANGLGTVYSIDSNGTYAVIYSFNGSSDPAGVYAPLLYSGGNLYGTSQGGGAAGSGTVFKVTLQGQETVLHSFVADDEIELAGALVEVNGVLYGTAPSGGNDTGSGTVFSLSKTGDFKKIHGFTGQDGDGPYAGLTVLNGVLYGTTEFGGVNYPEFCSGTVFSITPTGAFTLLHSFSGSDGCVPDSVLLNAGGLFYGTTRNGGSKEGNGHGVVFSVTSTGDNTVLGHLGSGGTNAFGNLVKKGKYLYGTSFRGGTNNDGTIFKAPMAGGKPKAYYSFGNTKDDGSGPVFGLVRNKNTFYGVTSSGGQYGHGAIFQLTQ